MELKDDVKLTNNVINITISVYTYQNAISMVCSSEYNIQKMSILNKFISKKNQHTYGLLLRIIGSLMWVYITAPIGAFVVILGEIVTWINFDEKEE